MSTLGDYLKGLREDMTIPKKPSQEDVALATGIPSATISQIENGHIKSPGSDKLSDLAKYYGVPVETLIDKIKEG
jgi:transcriptional regulator with XRE-family HTH domain